VFVSKLGLVPYLRTVTIAVAIVSLGVACANGPTGPLHFQKSALAPGADSYSEMLSAFNALLRPGHQFVRKDGRHFRRGDCFSLGEPCNGATTTCFVGSASCLYLTDTLTNYLMTYQCSSCTPNQDTGINLSVTNVPTGVTVDFYEAGVSASPSPSLEVITDQYDEANIDIIVSSTTQAQVGTVLSYTYALKCAPSSTVCSGSGSVTSTPIGFVAPTLNRVLLTQAIQKADGSVPLVANRATYAETFEQSSIAGVPFSTFQVEQSSYPPQPRNCEFSCSALVPSAVPTDYNPTGFCCVKLPANLAPSDSLTFTLLGTSTNPVSYPGSSIVLNPTIVATAPLTVQYVAVEFDANKTIGKASNVTGARVGTFLPIPYVNVFYNMPPIRVPAAHGSQATGDATQDIFAGLNRLKQRTYGVHDKLHLFQGVVPRAAEPQLPAGTQAGLEDPVLIQSFVDDRGGGDGETASVHELGHVYGLLHAPSAPPCGIPDGVDPNYMPPDGTIGSYGFDPQTNSVVPPTRPDFIGYCSGPWVGWYDWTKALPNVPMVSQAVKRPAARADVPINVSIYPYVLLIGGTTAPQLTLRPGFTMNDPGGTVPTSGADSISGYDISGNLLFTQPFDSAPYFDDMVNPSTSRFDIDVPLTASAYSNLHSITLTVPGGAKLSVTNAAVGPPVASAYTTDGQNITFTWNSLQYPAVFVNGSFVELLQAASSTSLTTTVVLPNATDTSLVCDFSNGVTSTTQTVSVENLQAPASRHRRP